MCVCFDVWMLCPFVCLYLSDPAPHVFLMLLCVLLRPQRGTPRKRVPSSLSALVLAGNQIGDEGAHSLAMLLQVRAHVAPPHRVSWPALTLSAPHSVG